jgi:hypothetical protein
MAIKGFKDIIERRGYKVESEDRKIFEKEIGKSYFGLGNADMIEFILFDASENQLPQGEDGKLVRYISLDEKNISEYFIISENNFTKKLNGASEFIVDIEKLIREAGYSSGIFKTQVTLLNRRAGKENSDTDKLWIHEISPSRTEIRVLPIKNSNNPNLDLEKRYETFTEEKQFRDDTIYYAKQYIQNITTKKVLDFFSRIKGKQKDTEIYHGLIRKEFKIDSVELLINRIREKFIESIEYFIDDRQWNIFDLNYGKPTNQLDVIQLSIDDINLVIEQSLGNVIEFYLPKRNIQEQNELTPEQQVTFDEVKQILKSSVSDNIYKSTEPNKVDAVIRGCMDRNALNYNPKAREDNGTCKYPEEVEEIEVAGCTDSSALNYNPQATKDDGSCEYKNVNPTKTAKYYVWSSTAEMKWKINGQPGGSKSGIEFDSFNITHDVGSFKFKGDVREVPKIRVPKPIMASFKITNQSRSKVLQPPAVFMNRYPGDEYRGTGFGNRDSFGRGPYDEIRYGERYYDERPFPIYRGNPLTFKYKDALGNIKTSGVIQPGGTTTICAQVNSLVLPNGLISTGLGSCSVTPTPAPTPNIIPIASTPRGGGGGGGGGSFEFIRNEFDGPESVDARYGGANRPAELTRNIR